MGYPLRWEQFAEPQCQARIVVQAVPITNSLKRYYYRVSAITLAIASLLIVTVITTFNFILADHVGPTLKVDTATRGIAISSLEPTVVRHLGYVAVSGKLLNRTPNSLRHVEAVVDLLDASRNTLRTQSAMVEREAIAPGQKSSFQLEMKDEPGATSMRLRFKNLYGSYLN